MNIPTRFKNLEVDFFNYHAVDIMELILETGFEEKLNQELIDRLQQKLKALCWHYQRLIVKQDPYK